jgi:hypothetical protein
MWVAPSANALNPYLQVCVFFLNPKAIKRVLPFPEVYPIYNASLQLRHYRKASKPKFSI